MLILHLVSHILCLLHFLISFPLLSGEAYQIFMLANPNHSPVYQMQLLVPPWKILSSQRTPTLGNARTNLLVIISLTGIVILSIEVTMAVCTRDLPTLEAHWLLLQQAAPRTTMAPYLLTLLHHHHLVSLSLLFLLIHEDLVTSPPCHIPNRSSLRGALSPCLICKALLLLHLPALLA